MITPIRLGFVAAVVALALDQASKFWVVARLSARAVPAETVTDFFNLVLTANTGISFSFFAGTEFGPILLSLVAVVVIAGLVVMLVRCRSLIAAKGYGLIIGGALGNLIDRVRLGSVVDFLDVHWGGWHPFVFNGADAAISVGVALLLLDGLLRSGDSPK